MEAKRYPDHLQAIEDFLEAGAKPGEIITHEWLDEHLRLDPDSKKYGIERVRKVQLFRKELLLQYKIDLKSVLGQGYYILPPREQSEDAEQMHRKEMKKSLQKALTRLVNIDHTQLTEAEEKQNSDYILLISSLGASTAKSLRKKRVEAIAST